MTKKEKLYETLGELIYVIAKADGVIQQEETQTLEYILKNHNWGKDIEWSFNYEVKKDQNIEAIYSKVINYCHSYGPSPIYQEFINLMNEIAESSNGIDKNEKWVITSFSKDLIARFQKDIDKGIYKQFEHNE